MFRYRQMQGTSLDAFYKHLNTFGPRQQAIITFFQRNARHTFTNLELSRALNWPINSVTPRVKELREKGVLLLDCVRTCTASATHESAMAWKLNPVYLNRYGDTL